MKKLQLDCEELRVESFPTARAEDAPACACTVTAPLPICKKPCRHKPRA